MGSIMMEPQHSLTRTYSMSCGGQSKRQFLTYCRDKNHFHCRSIFLSLLLWGTTEKWFMIWPEHHHCWRKKVKQHFLSLKCLAHFSIIVFVVQRFLFGNKYTRVDVAVSQMNCVFTRYTGQWWNMSHNLKLICGKSIHNFRELNMWNIHLSYQVLQC